MHRKILLRLCCCSIFLFMLLNACDGQRDCENTHRNLTEKGVCPTDSTTAIPCRDTCRNIYITGESSCSSTASHCCFVGGECVFKQLRFTQDMSTINFEDLKNKYVQNGSAMISSESEVVIQQRTLSLVPPELLSALAGTSCKRFPATCTVTSSDFLPPNNIPYCQRIPCSSDNPLLDFDIQGCYSNPGCYFDYELSLYRNILSHGILPGVPVCHLAVRNQPFQTRAKEYVQSHGSWNPVLTNCLIKEYENEIMGGFPGCYMVKTFEKLGYKAKRCGWKDITARDCYLLNGCWSEDKVCVYPLSPTELNVVSNKGVDDEIDYIKFGRPMCLPFNSSASQGSFLDEYHKCLSSGCAADINRDALLKHLNDVSQNYLPPLFQHQYWTMALLGQVRPDNWKQVANDLMTSFQGSFQSGLNTLLPPGIIGASVDRSGLSALPFSLSVNGSGQDSLREPFVTYGSFGEFGNSAPPQTFNNSISSRSLSTVISDQPMPRNLNIGNFADINPADANLQNTLSGLGTPPVAAADRRINFVCPYQHFHWPGFPPLKGIFGEECCKKPLCYLPRISIRNSFSGLTTYKTEWSSWSPCSATCGSALRTRRRNCIGDDCGLPEEQQSRCDTIPCPVYSQWSQFGVCSVSCGGGTRTRTRRCIGSGTCSGRAVDTTRCRIGACPRFRPRGAWSRCNVTCGKGWQKRSLRCINHGAYGCPTTTQYKERQCIRYCGTIKHLRSPCDTQTCLITITPVCEEHDGSPGYCEIEEATTRRCYDGPCRCQGFSLFCGRESSFSRLPTRP